MFKLIIKIMFSFMYLELTLLQCLKCSWLTFSHRFSIICIVQRRRVGFVCFFLKLRVMCNFVAGFGSPIPTSKSPLDSVHARLNGLSEFRLLYFKSAP